MTLTPRPGILDLVPYKGGESELAGFKTVIKLASNEGALGPSPKAIAALQEMAGSMHRYPDGGATRLRQTLGAHFGLDPERIVCGAGSDELLHLLAQAYAGPGNEVLYSRYGFLIYPIAATACGAKPVIAEEENLTASVDNLLAKVNERTRILFLANPNNPTGTYLPAAEVKRLRDNLPDHVLLVIDAAYAEYAGRGDYTPGAELVETSKNVVMTRTFSKIYAMGGLRLGWAYCSAEVADVLNRLRGPFNVSSAALEAGRAAIEDTDFVKESRRHNDTWRAWFEAEMVRLGLSVTPSVCNFVLVRFPDEPAHNAAAADAYLRSKGIIVRAMASYGLPHSLRVTIGREDEMKALTSALAEFLGA